MEKPGLTSIKLVPIYDKKGNLQVVDRYVNDEWMGSLGSFHLCFNWLDTFMEARDEKIEVVVVQASSQ